MPTIRQALALAVPAVAFAWWTQANPPTTIGWLGAGGFALTLLLSGVLALVARYRPPCRARERGAALTLLLVGTALTASYWWRVWSYRDWELGGVAVGAAFLIGFWWPAVALALAMWVLEEIVAAPGGWPRLRVRLGAGLAAGVAGVVLYAVLGAVQERIADRLPLGEALAMITQELGGLAPRGGQLPYRLEHRHLQIDVEAGPGADDRPYVALTTLERALARARQLAARKDVHEVTLVLRAHGGELARLTPNLTEHEVGVLLERVGRVGYVVDVAEDATARVILDDNRAYRSGPWTVRAGETLEADGRTVRNLGWLPREAFRASRQ